MIGQIIRRYSKIKKRIEELRYLIQTYNYEYYVLSKPSINDFEYDKMFQELKLLETKNPQYITKDSPTQNVGIKTEDMKTPHIKKMLSLNNAFSYEDLKKFDKKFDKKFQTFKTEKDFYICEKKFDGIAVSIQYNKEMICLTRGDGEYGQNITENIKHYIPEMNRTDLNLEVRGEVIIKKDEFQKISDQYSNSRNIISGLLLGNKKKDIKLNFIAYQLIDEKNIYSQLESLLYLKNLGFEIDSNYYLSNSIDDIYYNFIQSINRNELNYDIDGIVIKINSFQIQNLIGESKRYPKWAIAYKFPSKQVKTKLLDIKYQVTRNGKIVPIGIIEPVELGGTKIKKGSLFNFDYIIKNRIDIGDEINVSRAGDVVPKIEIIKLKEESEYELPKVCPCDLKYPLERINEQLYCKNEECKEILILKIQHFIEILGIKGISTSIITDLILNKFIKNYKDIFYLYQHQNEWMKIKGYGNKKITNILLGIEKSKENITFLKLLIAVGYPPEKSKKINEKYSNFKEFDIQFQDLDLFIPPINK